MKGSIRSKLILALAVSLIGLSPISSTRAADAEPASNDMSPETSHGISHDASHEMAAPPPGSRLRVAVLLYDSALMLDFGIASEMLLAADMMGAFEVFTVSETGTAHPSIVGSMSTDFRIDNAPTPDVIIVPGGMTWPQQGSDPEIVAYLQSAQADGAILLGVCTGAMLLAQAGLLDSRDAITNHQAIPMMRRVSPSTRIIEGAVFVDDGNIITTSGSGSAIEATLHLIERLVGREIAEDLRGRYLDYPYALPGTDAPAL